MRRGYKKMQQWTQINEGNEERISKGGREEKKGRGKEEA